MRVTSFAVQADGSRSYGITVNGVRVLVTCEAGKHVQGLALANQIADLGPEGIEPVAPPSKLEEPKAYVQKRRDFAVGDRVWCNVHGAEGECTVTAVGDGRNAGRVKITGERCWCPISNFDALDEPTSRRNRR